MSAAPEHVLTRQGVVIAIDPHKASFTFVVVTPDLAAVAVLRVEVNRAGYWQLRRFAAGWPDARWAIEGAVGLGAPLALRLHDRIVVIDVPAKLARRVRLLSTGHGRKSDKAEALSVGIAAWSAPALRTVGVDEAIAALPAVSEYRAGLGPLPDPADQPAARRAGQAHPLRTGPRPKCRGGRPIAAPRPATRHTRAHSSQDRGRPGR